MPKILFIRFSSIGDIVLCSPVVRCVKEQLGAEVHFLTKRSYQSLLAASPYIDKIFTLEKQVSELMPQLQAESYDYIIDLHKNLRSIQIRRGLKRPYFTFDKLNFQKWLLVNFKINRLPDLHIVDRYMAGIKALGVRYDGKGLDFFIPKTAEIQLGQFFEKHPLAKWQNGYIAFAIGAQYATKRLPVEKIIEICEKTKSPIVLLGGPGDMEAGKKVAAASSGVLDTCGQLSIVQSASLIRQSQQVISHDTGLMHIAAAFKKPIISVWGNTVPDFGMFPFYPDGQDQNKTIEVLGLPCRPCSKIGFDICPKGHFKCMKNIDAADFFHE